MFKVPDYRFTVCPLESKSISININESNLSKTTDVLKQRINKYVAAVLHLFCR